MEKVITEYTKETVNIQDRLDQIKNWVADAGTITKKEFETLVILKDRGYTVVTEFVPTNNASADILFNNFK